MYRTTGLYRDEITDLCALIHEATIEADATWPPKFGLYKSVLVTLIYLRHNRVQEELAETYETSQSTISRAITTLTPLLAELLARHVPTAGELDPARQYIIDGTLLPCWSWASHPELYSGKHKTTGMNLQLACTLEGQLAWVSDPINGARRDTHCLGESAALQENDPGNWVGDKGYIGNGMITPFRKPADRELLDWEKEFNTGVNKIRYVIERVTANSKTWRIMHTDYHRRRAGVIFHTDRGSTYTAREFAALCFHLGISQSMGRVGSCFDNAAAGSFFSTLEHEVLSRYHFRTRAEAKQHIVSWVCDFYNSRRRHSAWGMQSPIDYEHSTRVTRPQQPGAEAA